MPACLAFYQKNPSSKPKIKAILQLIDNNIYSQTVDRRRVYRTSLVTPEGFVLMADSSEFLKELARQSKLSQITYEYNEDEDRIAEYMNLLIPKMEN